MGWGVPHFADVLGLDFGGIDAVEGALVVVGERACFIFIFEEFLVGKCIDL